MEFREDNSLLFIAIAKNNVGFEKINRYRSYVNNAGTNVPSRCPTIDETFIVYPFGRIEPEALKANEFIGVRFSQLTKFMLRREYSVYKDRFVILHPVTFADKQGFNIHRLSRAIHHNLLLSKLPPNHQAQEDEVLIPESELVKKFYEFPELIRNTKNLIDQCEIHFELGVDKNKKSFTGSPESDWDFFITRSWEGFQEKYDSSDPFMRERFERELKIIQLKDFCTYYFPGINQATVEAIVNTPGLKAIVLETFGSGNAPSSQWLIVALKDAIERGVIVLNISQCPGGMVIQGKYQTSKVLDEIGVISGADMTTEAAVTKLMILMGEYGPEKAREWINKPLAGDLTSLL